MQDTIKLDGREFVSIDHALTASQDDYILAHLRIAGVMDILSDADGKSRTGKKRAEELLTQILLAGETQPILAGCLTEVGKKWNREEAERNTEKFRNISDKSEKAVMRTLIIRLVICFFGLGGTSRATSGKSSSPSGTVPPTENAEPSISGTSVQ